MKILIATTYFPPARAPGVHRPQVDGTATALQDLGRRWLAGKLDGPHLSPDLLRRLSRREWAERLAQPFRSLR